MRTDPTIEPVEILLVEDNEDDIIILREALNDSKMMNLVQVVGDGEQALAYLRKQGEFRDASTPGLVLMDINMPKMNGLEALEAIKSDPDLRHVPVVMLTVSDREEDVLRSFQAGAVSYIRKPVEFMRLKEVTDQFELYWTLVSRIPRDR